MEYESYWQTLWPQLWTMSGPTVARFRQELTEWIEAQLTQGVQLRYAKARALFPEWCCLQGLSLEEREADEADVVVANFVMHVKEDSDDLTWQGCSDSLATMQRRAGMKLHFTWQVLRLWGRELPPKKAEDVPAIIAFASVTVMSLVLGEPEAVFHTLVAFSGLLRIGESLQLRRGDIVLPRPSGPRQVVLVLRTIKRGFDQRAVLNHPKVVAPIQGYLQYHEGQDHELAAPLTYGRFARCLKKVVALSQVTRGARTACGAEGQRP